MYVRRKSLDYIVSVRTALVAMSLMIVAFGESVAEESVPALVNYQGLLTEQSGSLAASGDHRIEFRIWTSPTENELESLIWGATYDVSVVDGRFNIILGAPGGMPLETSQEEAAVDSVADAFRGSERYLGLTVIRRPTDTVNVTNPSEILPRQRIVSAPYALSAESSTSAREAGAITGPVNFGLSQSVGDLSVGPGQGEELMGSAQINVSGKRPVLILFRGNSIGGGTYTDINPNGQPPQPRGASWRIARAVESGGEVQVASGSFYIDSLSGNLRVPQGALTTVDLDPPGGSLTYRLYVSYLGPNATGAGAGADAITMVPVELK